jgi:hypothetical protein
MYPMQWAAVAFIVILAALVAELGFGIDLGIRDMIDSIVGGGDIDLLPN